MSSDLADNFTQFSLENSRWEQSSSEVVFDLCEERLLLIFLWLMEDSLTFLDVFWGVKIKRKKRFGNQWSAQFMTDVWHAECKHDTNDPKQDLCLWEKPRNNSNEAIQGLNGKILIHFRFASVDIKIICRLDKDKLFQECHCQQRAESNLTEQK